MERRHANKKATHLVMSSTQVICNSSCPVKALKLSRAFDRVEPPMPIQIPTVEKNQVFESSVFTSYPKLLIALDDFGDLDASSSHDIITQ